MARLAVVRDLRPDARLVELALRSGNAQQRLHQSILHVGRERGLVGVALRPVGKLGRLAWGGAVPPQRCGGLFVDLENGADDHALIAPRDVPGAENFGTSFWHFPREALERKAEAPRCR